MHATPDPLSRRGKTATVRIKAEPKRQLGHIAAETEERPGEVLERLIEAEWGRIKAGLSTGHAPLTELVTS